MENVMKIEVVDMYLKLVKIFSAQTILSAAVVHHLRINRSDLPHTRGFVEGYTYSFHVTPSLYFLGTSLTVFLFSPAPLYYHQCG